MLTITSTFAVPAALREERPAWASFRSPGLWPVPHLPGLDFRTDGEEAAWIDGIAMRAKDRLLHLPAEGAVPGHSDYCVQNLLFAGTRIVTVYDWDSLVAEREEVLVGLAAATFPGHGGLFPDRPAVPSPAQRRAFVESFERARGAAFTDEQRREIVAAAAWVTAYNARVMYAFGQPGRQMPGTNAYALAELAEELATL
jgi:aminoglycoside phosphotransferase (APT) family kinase protein